MADGDSQHDLKFILSSGERDFLVRNNGDQVKISDLSGKTTGLYFSASWCGPCRRFTPELIDVYNDLSAKGGFEIVFVSADQDEEEFNGYFSKMPWLAIPFSDSDTRDRLDGIFQVNGIPHLVILDANGKVSTEEGVEIIGEYGVEAYPFTSEIINQLKEEEEAAKKEQSLRSILVSSSRDFLISNDGNKVPVSELEGKVVGLYFCSSFYGSCVEFTKEFVGIYNELKEKAESFEVVLISLDDDEESYKKSFEIVPWLALPFKDKSISKLVRYFELSTVPTLVIIGTDGKTLHSNAVKIIEEHGIQGYPFTAEKLAELAEIEKARLEAQTLESILVSGDRDFVIGKDGAKIPVSKLLGKNILLYFSAEWCPPCRAFLPKLIKAYHEIKAKDDGFEVIFISSDSNQSSFDEFYSGMPWLALPFGDERKKSLNRRFKVTGIPTAVAIGSSGRTVTTDARNLLMAHGADAYPFTDERVKEIESQLEEIAKGWPKNVKHPLHEHELFLTRRRIYNCDGCEEVNTGWSFYCKKCDYDLHPQCALKASDDAIEENANGDNETKEGWICDGEVCFKAN
ncbi:PREDICTED: probable nucleoredoxin 1 [Nelumbo nucifera]|uniref:protein-disulfide reductase n=1 Tax=Nelumbo nucifera TaxID=4432 RepID=A0A1U7Z7S7_NELNU|nr:PREDICTED: probable nucleoredoxin 1 [Nelumbo nucifera]